jgi:hypothetical protein
MSSEAGQWLDQVPTRHAGQALAKCRPIGTASGMKWSDYWSDRWSDYWSNRWSDRWSDQ